jgi:hypothetical protein
MINTDLTLSPQPWGQLVLLFDKANGSNPKQRQKFYEKYLFWELYGLV